MKLLAFKTQILDELNYCVKIYEHYKSESIDLNEYKLRLVDNIKIFTLILS
jgi:hypothetical protein